MMAIQTALKDKRGTNHDDLPGAVWAFGGNCSLEVACQSKFDGLLTQESCIDRLSVARAKCKITLRIMRSTPG